MSDNTKRVSRPIQRQPEPVESFSNRITEQNFRQTYDDRATFANEGSRRTFAYDDRSTFANGAPRRTFTNDHAGLLFRRTLTLTTGIDPDSEEAWTHSYIERFKKAEEKSVAVGYTPMPAAFARDMNFWKAFMLSSVIGAVLGVVSVGFLNAVDKIPRLWVNGGPTTVDDDFFVCGTNPEDCTKYENCQWYHGKKNWIAITGGTGLLVGLIRHFTKYPDNLPGLFQEINECHVDPKWAIHTIMLSVLSLAGGSSLGPEQGLGNLGGGTATYLTQKYFFFEDDDYRKLTVLGGMASALGALFPTPVLGVLMFQELGNPPKTYMESILILASGACTAFLVYYAIINKSFVASITSNGQYISLQWEFQEWHCLVAALIGVISACLALVLIIFIGISKQVFNRIRLRLDNFPFLAKVVPPVIAGLAIGTVNWALPLTVGNGNQTLAALIQYGYEGTLSTNLLLCTGFSRMFLLAISMNSGFVGGFVFPILTIGLIAGVVAKQMYDQLPLGLAMGCFMSSLPASICPFPLTLCGISIYVFYFGTYQTAPIFISSIVSYTLIVGSGLLGELQKRSKENEVKLASAVTVEEEKSKESHEVDRISVKSKEDEETINRAKQVYLDQLEKATHSPLQEPLKAEDDAL